jgi:hypothetical protein
MLTFGTRKLLLYHFHDTSAYFQRFAFNQRLRNFTMGRFKDVSECLPGNTHLVSRLFLVKPLQVSQPNSFKFVHRKTNFLKNIQRNRPGLEIIRAWTAANSPAF